MIDIPQVFVSYAGGSGGEWLAIQLGKHDKYYNDEIDFSKNELNRWRLQGSWRSYMLDETDFQKNVWTEQEYDNSSEWWDNFWNNAPETEYYYQTVRDLIQSKKRYTIPVHRCHEVWYDEYWKNLFLDFKKIIIKVDREHEQTMHQFQGNIIKKIFWQDFDDKTLEQEMSDKCRKHKVDYVKARQRVSEFSGVINYTDMMLAIFLEETNGDMEWAIEKVLILISSRWNDYNILQHYHPVGDSFTIDFGDIFIKKSYSAYTDMIEYLGATPLKKDEWMPIINDYADEDMQQVITIDDVRERLWNRVIEKI